MYFRQCQIQNAAGDEVFAMFRRHLIAYQYDHIYNDWAAPSDNGRHSLDTAARLVPEDLLLLGPFANAAADN